MFFDNSHVDLSGECKMILVARTHKPLSVINQFTHKRNRLHIVWMNFERFIAFRKQHNKTGNNLIKQQIINVFNETSEQITFICKKKNLKNI